MSTLDWSLQQATKTTAQIAAATTTIPLTGQIVWNTDTGKYCIGDGTTALSSLVFYGGISASGLTVGTTTITGGTSTRVLYNNAGVVGEYAVTGTGTTAVLSVSPVFGTDITTPLIKGSGGILQTFSTDLVNIGNKTTTSQRMLRVGQDTGWADIGSVPSQTSYMGLWLNQANPSSLNYAISSDNLGGIRVNATSGQSLILKVADTTKLQLAASNAVFNLSASAFGAIGIPYTFNIPAHTATTATVNTPNFQITGSNKQWATGTVANQYWNYLSANTANFVGASTMTNSYGLYVEAATAGTNATITNNYSFGTNGKAKFGGNIELTQTVTTEAVTSDRTVTIVINGTTYKLLAKA